jgi:hypothetical protein
LPHIVCPAAQVVAHCPDEQTSPEAHALPQAPQFWGSLASVTQTPPHIVCPDAQVVAHCPDEHTSPEAHV